MDRHVLERLKAIDLEECLNMNLIEFYQFLGPKRLGLIADEQSFKLFVLDYLYKAYHDDDAQRPIKYIEKEEE